MTKKVREYIDRDHEVMDEYYDLCENYTGRNRLSTRRKLEKMIEKDPDFLDSYLLLRDILRKERNPKEAEKVLDRAYKRAINMITDRNGNWPDILEWGWLENRHIMRTVLNKALSLWEAKDYENALTLLRNVLKTNPGDNAGVRYYILAIRMGMDFRQFEPEGQSPLFKEGSQNRDSITESISGRAAVQTAGFNRRSAARIFRRALMLASTRMGSTIWTWLSGLMRNTGIFQMNLSGGIT